VLVRERSGAHAPPKAPVGEGFREYREDRGDFVWVEVSGAKDVERAIEASSPSWLEEEEEKKKKEKQNKGIRFVVVDCTNWKIIPLENLIGEFRRRQRKVYAFMKSENDIKLAFSILEKGVDGVVIPYSSLTESKGLIAETVASLGGGEQEGGGGAAAATGNNVHLTKAKIKRVMEVGNGERVCIDTASQLEPGEGMLIGSAASFFFLVHSETIPTEYIPTRPFRVNAGALHSYILGTDGKTRYLSELRAGDKVQVVEKSGSRREATVGRIKMERRPLIMVRAECEGHEGTAMLQNAETIRLVRPDGTPVAVTEVKQGDEVLVHIPLQTKGRHFGGEVDEFVIER
jgi:3-dehydroquinate synthase II